MMTGDISAMGTFRSKLFAPWKLIAAAHLAVLTVLCTAPKECLAESANRLVVEAREALTSADFEPDPMARLVLLRRALDRLDRIVAEHPNNPLADQIINGGKVAGTSRPRIRARLAGLRSQPEICFAEPGPGCLTAVAIGFSRKFAYLRDRVAAGTAIAKVLLAMGDQTAALGLIEDSLKSALRINSVARRVRALIQIVAAQVRADDPAGALQNLNHALKAARALEAAGARSRALSRIAGLFVDLQQGEQAHEILREAMSEATGVMPANAEIELLTRLARQFQVVGDLANAELLVNSARKAVTRIEDPYDLAWAQIGTARTLRDIGQAGSAVVLVDRATESANTVVEPRIRASLITEIAGLLADWGEEDRAGNLLDQLLADTLRLALAADRREILWWIARTRIAAGHTPSARRALELLLDEARQAPANVRTGLLSRLAVALANTGDPETAQRAIEAAHEAALGLSAPEQQVMALLSVAEALARMGQANAGAALLIDIWNAGGYRDPAFARRAGIEPLLIIAAVLAGPVETGNEDDVGPRD